MVVSPYRLLLAGDEPLGSPWRTGAALLNIRCDFGSMRDAMGRAMFHPFWLTLVEDGRLKEWQEWAARWQAEGHTHVVLARRYAYPGSPIPGKDFTPSRFVELVRFALLQGFAPILMLSDTPDEAPLVLDIVQRLTAGGLLPYVICVPAWEPIPTRDWTSKQLSDLLIAMQAAGGDALVLGVHLQPGRWSMSSHPLEPDDPWQGSESGCWKSHGGEHVSVFLYQLEHGFTQTTAPDWQNRWRDGVPRLGNGMNGWRRIPICLFETVLFDSYRGHCDARRAREIATEARDIAWTEFGVPITYGNGVPL